MTYNVFGGTLSLTQSIIVKQQTNSNCGTFSMFNIIETLWNYFACELLPNNLSSEVPLQFSVS